MKDNLVIIGSHPRTRGNFDFDRTDCDVWVFNEAMKDAWCKRADAVFQLHQPVIWRSKTNRNDPHHYDWLKSGKTPAIIMLDKYEDVPQSEAYPLDEVLALSPRRYFTSSVSYAIALGIYRGYKQIEVFGVEMETNTEYLHQREGVAYWIGVADGKGIELIFHSGTMLRAPLYGFEGDIKLPVEYYKNRINIIAEPCNVAQKAYESAKANVYAILDEYQKDSKADITGLNNLVIKMAQHGHDFGVADGARQVCEKYLAKVEEMLKESGEFFIGRQEYEGPVNAYQAEWQKQTARVQTAANHLQIVRKELDGASNRDRRRVVIDEFKRVLDVYVKESTAVGILNGVHMENRQMIASLDQLVKAAGGEKAEAVMLEAIG
jgi:hypothetical protein